jgi:hypothetical protein
VSQEICSECGHNFTWERTLLTAYAELLESAKEELKYGKHEGDCTNDWEEGPCLKHVEASSLREKRLEAAVENLIRLLPKPIEVSK